MYRGIGDSTTDLSSVTAAIAGPKTSCDAGYSYSSLLGVCVADSGLCDAGYTFNVVTGVCEQSSTGVMAWLGTGNNAVYAGAGVLAILLVLMMGKR